MDKIIQKAEKINPFGGINFIANTFKKYGIPELIDKHMGKRPSQAGYKYSDIFLSLAYSHYGGSSCIEDINYLKGYFTKSPLIKFCTSDTLEYVCNQIKRDNEVIISETGVTHEFNRPLHLNRLLLQSSLHTKQLRKGSCYNLDYDNVITVNEKYDSKRTYKQNTGYQPGVGFIGKLPVYIEGRNGNSPAKFKMDETFEHMFSLLGEAGIRIKNFRSDSAAYQKKVIEKIKEHCDFFYIRVMDCQELMMQVRNIEQWTSVEINYETYDIASIDYCPFGEKEKYRVVIQRRQRKDKQIDLFAQGAYTYAGIITNNYEEPDVNVILFYNKRSSLEPNFHYLNEDFNWKHMPFSFLDANTVFMIISAISCILFEFIKSIYSRMVDFVKPSMRMKRFIMHFVTVATKWISSGRQRILKVYTQKNYKALLC